jgi:hypothetical protein
MAMRAAPAAPEFGPIFEGGAIKCQSGADTLGMQGAANVNSSDAGPQSSPCLRVLAVAFGKVCERYRVYRLAVFIVDAHRPS